MGEIIVLDSLVADMIAAGEVVERPASVVKELCENSIDAGAQKIEIELTRGGMSLIKVSDDGRGIDRSEVATAFFRHATSKIRTSEDLYNINTLGFRGEALCSIAAVSRVEIMTKPAGQPFGAFLSMRSGEIVEQREVGCPDGTVITVRDLFFNTPARMKFLKKDAREAALVSDIAEKLALSYPGISFRLIIDGKEKLYTPGDSDLKSAVYSIFGRDYADALTQVDYNSSGVSVSGVCGKPVIARSTRGYQIIFVNGRFIKNRNLAFVAENAYSGSLMVGKFPFFVLNIEINPALIDVNVHPSKLEVKFSDEKAVNNTLYWAVKNALESEEMIPQISKLPHNAPPPAKHTPTFFSANNTAPVLKQNSIEYHRSINETVNNVIAEDKEKDVSDKNIRVIGQAFSSYIIVERDDDILLIDQHAAHERMIFEQLLSKRGQGAVTSQMLMEPVVINASRADYQNIRDNLDMLINVGFDIEEFGGNSFVIRGAPIVTDRDDIETLFFETLRAAELSTSGRPATQTETDALHSIACHKALKANHRLNPLEMEKFALDALACELPGTCPHGRPITIAISKAFIEKQFGRT